MDGNLSPEFKSMISQELKDNNYINKVDFVKYGVKRGLRNADGTGVMAGLTKICSVEGYYMDDGEKIPKKGHLYYRGVDLDDIVDACVKENRFGFEEVAWLLLFGHLPTKKQLEYFEKYLSDHRELPENFTEDMIMKAPSPDIMNKLARGVLSLYSYDDNPDDTSLENVLQQSLNLIAQTPTMIAYDYQVKRRHYYHKSMYIHPPVPGQTTAQVLLYSLRSDKQFTDEEAKLLDRCLMIHAEHGGGNNSTFATRVLSSSGTDTYSAIAAGIGSLKGPRHGGANKKVSQMVDFFMENVDDVTDENQVADYLRKILRKEAGDGSGLIYGMGHAVYTLSDPRAVILKREAEKFCKGKDFEKEFRLLSNIEKMTPIVFKEETKSDKCMCANVDLYSGFVYKMLDIPADLYTPLFATARMVGWTAHRIEELYTGGRIIRPAYKSIEKRVDYVPLDERKRNQE
jgi:citrate synthase